MGDCCGGKRTMKRWCIVWRYEHRGSKMIIVYWHVVACFYNTTLGAVFKALATNKNKNSSTHSLVFFCLTFDITNPFTWL